MSTEEMRRDWLKRLGPRPEAVIRLTLWNPAPFTDGLSGETLNLVKPDWMDIAEFVAVFVQLQQRITEEHREFFDVAGLTAVRPYAIERAVLETIHIGEARH